MRKRENQYRQATKPPERRRFQIPFRSLLTKKRDFSITNFFIFMTFLGILYIANDYYSKELLGSIDEKTVALQRIKEDYQRTKYEYDTKMRKEYIAKLVKARGLRESSDPIIQLQPRTTP